MRYSLRLPCAHPFATALLACSSLIFVPPLHAQAAQSNTIDNTQPFDIPAASLADALTKFGLQSGLQMSYSSGLVKGLTAPAVKGTYSSQDVLARLLAGKALAYRVVGGSTVVIVKLGDDEGAAGKPQSRVLGPVRVEGQSDTRAPGEGIAQLGGVRGAQDEEAVGYRARVASVTGGRPQAIEDIPRSISVLTQDQMRAQDIQDVSEALRKLPGITLIQTSSPSPQSGAGVYSRGYSITKMQVDGEAPRSLNVLGNGILDMGAYERVELVRGPNGMNTGTGSAGGSINFVRKRPGAAPSLEFSTTFSTLDRKHGQVDFSTPGVLGSAFAFRGVASYQDQEFFWDDNRRRNSLVYGMFDAPLGEDARLEIGGQYTRSREDGYYAGLRRYLEGDVMPFPHDYNYVPREAFAKSFTAEAFGRLHARLNDRWNVQLGVSYEDREYGGAQVLQNGGGPSILKSTNAPPGGIQLTTGMRFQRADQGGFSVDLKLAGRFETLGLAHDVLIGTDYRDEITSGSREFWYSGYALVNTITDLRSDVEFIPLGVLYPGMGYPMDLHWLPIESNTSGSSQSIGVVVNDTISWRDRVELALSARRFRSESSSGGPGYNNVTGAPTGFSFSDSKSTADWRPSWYLTLRPYGGFRVFGSYSEGFESQSTRFDVDRQPLEPMTYQNREIGVKYGAPAWEASLTTYKLERSNVGQSIPGTLCPPTPTSTCFFRAGATERSTGIDFEVVGEVWRGLSVVASYNRSNAKTVSTNLPLQTRTPAVEGKLFAEWVPSFVRDTRMRLGASYHGRVFEAGQSRIYDALTGAQLFSTPYQYAEPATTVYDFGLSHNLFQQFSLDLLVENVTNKRYYSTIGAYVNYPGPSRTATLSVRWANSPFARDAGGGRSPSTGMAPFGDLANWYGRIQTGLGEPMDIDATAQGRTRSSWVFEADRGSANFLALGYRLSSQWRAEAEAGLRQARYTAIGGSTTAPFGVCSTRTGAAAAPGCDEPVGGSDVYSLIGTVVRDFGSAQSRIQPYVGLGIGPVLFSHDFGGRMSGVGSNANGTGTAASAYNLMHGDSTKWTFGWQAQAGVAFRLTDRARIDLGYRYFDIPKVKWTADTSPLGSVDLASFEGSYESHSVALGLNWRFDSASAAGR